jgi:hypothetical protein
MLSAEILTALLWSSSSTASVITWWTSRSWADRSSMMAGSALDGRVERRSNGSDDSGPGLGLAVVDVATWEALPAGGMRWQIAVGVSERMLRNSTGAGSALPNPWGTWVSRISKDSPACSAKSSATRTTRRDPVST